MRFSVSDNPNDSVTEAAIDAFDVIRAECGDADCLTLSVTSLVGGERSDFTVFNGTTGQQTAILWSTSLGSFVYEGSGWCADFGLQIPANKPLSRLVSQGVFDGSGQYTAAVRIPGSASGLELHFQAAERGTCPDPCMSNIVTETVQ